ncbi:MAG: hypothetical protein Q9179_000071 [Wetmoreana sp. 5 TL-2023]
MSAAIGTLKPTPRAIFSSRVNPFGPFSFELPDGLELCVVAEASDSEVCRGDETLEGGLLVEPIQSAIPIEIDIETMKRVESDSRVVTDVDVRFADDDSDEDDEIR